MRRQAKEAVEQVNAELARKNTMLAQLASHDGLTGLLNHRTFLERLSEKVAEARRYRRALAVIMLDLDYFKALNDRYGHPLGDRMLEQVARTLEAELRETDLVGRYGGEEFVVAMPAADPEEAQRRGHEVAERLRQASAGLRLEEAPEVRVTASVGIACTGSKGSNAADLIRRADEGLYEAKEAGRNRVVCRSVETTDAA